MQLVTDGDLAMIHSQDSDEDLREHLVRPLGDCEVSSCQETTETV